MAPDAATRLRGVGWDHVRCSGPLTASIARYRQVAPAVEVGWSYRSLHHFGEGALDVLARDGYDLVIFDHPFVGEAAASGYLVDLSPHLPAGAVDRYLNDSVGPSARSYLIDGGFYGLPIDAAAQVAASRPDVLGATGQDVPRTLDAVFRLAGALWVQGRSISLPLKPTDALCCLITRAGNAGHRLARRGAFIAPDAGVEALETLRRLADLCPSDCLLWNPIRCLDTLSRSDTLAYVPYTFGYSSYARPNGRPPLAFHDIPAVADRGVAGSLLGGAGIGVFAGSAQIDAAVAYADWLCRPENQANWYVASGGQPGSRAAWTAPGANAMAGNFFADTLHTHDGAYLRPRFPGFLDFFRASTLTVHAALTGDTTPAAAIDTLNTAWLRTLEADPQARLEGVDDEGA